jgi:hypothetical protein
MIRSPHRYDTLTVFAITILLGCALGGILVSFLVSQ